MLFKHKKDDKAGLVIGLGLLFGMILGIAIKNPIFGIIIGLFVAMAISKRFKGKIDIEERIKDKIKEKMEEKQEKKKPENIINIPKFKFNWKTIIWIILILLVLWFFRPWFHEIVMVFYTKPLILFFLVSAIITSLLFVKQKQKIGAVLMIVTIIFFVTMFFSDIIMQKYIVQETTYNKIENLPESSQLRILPRAVARRYLEDSLQKSREKIGDLNIVNINNELKWIAPRVPDGFVIYFTQKVNGLMMADATKTERKTNMVTRTLNVGEDIGIADNIYWRLYKTRYFIDIGDIYYIQRGEGVLTIAPIVAYKFKFPVMIPYYDGVFVLNEKGDAKKYTPEEVLDLDYFENNRAYPEALSRLYVNSYQYRLGILNAWFVHEDQIEISDVYGQQNQQPFLMPTEEGLKWIVATEPHGESYGVFKIFVVDALTGKIDMLELKEDKTLTGPVKVVSYVRKKFPRIDWETATIAEPRPYVIHGKLYWMLSVTPRDFAGISYTVLVDSENNDVLVFETVKEIEDFISKGIVTEETEEEETKEDKIGQLIESIEKQLEELRELV